VGKIHNEGLNDLYCPPTIVIKLRRMGWARHVAHTGERRGLYRVLARKPEVRRPLGRPRRRWEDNVKIIFTMRYVAVWTGLSWLRIGRGGGQL
jgi:hypothetical protein